MPVPVKVSDRLLTLAKAEGKSTHRSATAQIEHWATLGRAVEVMIAYGDVLALKRAGESFPIPDDIGREDVHDLLARLTDDANRTGVKARIRAAAAGGPVYTGDGSRPGTIIEVQPDDTRTRGRLKDRRFVPSGKKVATRGA